MIQLSGHETTQNQLYLIPLSSFFHFPFPPISYPFSSNSCPRPCPASLIPNVSTLLSSSQFFHFLTSNDSTGPSIASSPFLSPFPSTFLFPKSYTTMFLHCETE